MSRCQHGSPWPFLATRLYRSLLPGGLQGYILYRHRAVVLAGCLTFSRPCEGFHRSMSLMSSFLLLLPCPACLFRLTRIVFVMGGRWPYSCCFAGCCLQDLFIIACSILVKLPLRFFSIRFVSVRVVHPYSSITWNYCICLFAFKAQMIYNSDFTKIKSFVHFKMKI